MNWIIVVYLIGVPVAALCIGRWNSKQKGFYDEPFPPITAVIWPLLLLLWVLDAIAGLTDKK